MLKKVKPVKRTKAKSGETVGKQFQEGSADPAAVWTKNHAIETRSVF
jgi:hypothetical protein